MTAKRFKFRQRFMNQTLLLAYITGTKTGLNQAQSNLIKLNEIKLK